MLKPEDAEKVLTKNLANVIRKANTGKPLTAAERALIEQAAAGGTPQDTGSAFAKTYDELAQRFGLTRKTLQNASKRFPDDVPKPRPDGRHDVAAWSQFLIRHNIARTAENIAGASTAESQDENRPISVTDWKARELELKCEKLEIENAKSAGQLVEAHDVEAGTTHLVSGFRQALNNFAPRLAQKLDGVTDYHERVEVIQAEADVVLKTLQRCDFLDGRSLETASPVVHSPKQTEQELSDHQVKGRPKAGSKKPGGKTSATKSPPAKTKTRPDPKRLASRKRS